MTELLEKFAPEKSSKCLVKYADCQNHFVRNYKSDFRARAYKTDTVLTLIISHPYCQWLLAPGSKFDNKKVIDESDYLIDIIYNNMKYACKKNDTYVVKCLLKLNINFDDYPCLNTAIKNGSFDVIKILIEDARFHIASESELKLLTLAIKLRHNNIVRLLLQDKRISRYYNINNVLEHCMNKIDKGDKVVIDQSSCLRDESIMSNRLSILLQDLIKSYNQNKKLTIIDNYFPKEYLLTKVTSLYLKDCPVSFLPWDVVTLICRFSIYLGE
jgi:hypothetical protein